MNKTDNRIYNRKNRRDLSIEMDLFIYFNGKSLSVPGSFYNNMPVTGKIVNVIYNVHKGGNICICDLDNGSQFSFSVKFGKPIVPSKAIIL